MLDMGQDASPVDSAIGDNRCGVDVNVQGAEKAHFAQFARMDTPGRCPCLAEVAVQRDLWSHTLDKITGLRAEVQVQ